MLFNHQNQANIRRGFFALLVAFCAHLPFAAHAQTNLRIAEVYWNDNPVGGANVLRDFVRKNASGNTTAIRMRTARPQRGLVQVEFEHTHSSVVGYLLRDSGSFTSTVNLRSMTTSDGNACIIGGLTCVDTSGNLPATTQRYQFSESSIGANTSNSAAERLDAGYWYFGLKPVANQEATIVPELGSPTNPIVFPTVAEPSLPTGFTANHGDNGVSLSWTKAAARHSSFDIFYKTSTGVDSSDESVQVSEATANCQSTTSGGATTHTRACRHTIPYADLSGIADNADDGYFRIRARINHNTSGLTSEAHAATPPLVLGDSQNLADTTRTFAFNTRDVSIALGNATGGGVSSSKTYRLLRTAGVAELANLGLQAVQTSDSEPISITNLPDGTRSGSITLRYEVDDTSNATTDSYTFTITVGARPAVRLAADSHQCTISLDCEFSVQASGGVGDLSVAHTGGDLPDGLRINGTSISGTPTESGEFGLTFTVTDGFDDFESEFTFTLLVRASLDTAELAKTALPDIVLAMADSTASGIKSRISEVRRGCSAAAEFSLDGATDFASIVQSQAEYEIHGNRNWRKMLGNSKFAVSHDNDSVDSGFCGVWGQGNFQNLDGEHSGVKWDGSLSGFALGADTRLGSGKLLGIAVNNQSGAFDITKDATTSQYDVAFSSVSPYLGWQSANGTNFHANLSIDSGEGEIKTSGNVTKHDLSGVGVGFGFRSSGKFKGDLVYSSVTADESVADGADISESIGVGRLRLAWERSRERVLASGASLNLNGEFGGRADTGTAGGGFGAELGFGFGYAKNSLKFGGNLRTLLFHSGDVGEFGAQIRLSIQPGQDQQGLSLNIAPTYGQTASSLANLWENGIGKITSANPDSYKMRINAQLGFGFSLADAGLFTPYATANYGDVPQFGLGLNWKPKLRDLELDLLGEQSDSQQRVLLKGSLGF